MSLYLAFRYIPKKNYGFSDLLIPEYPNIKRETLYPVKDSKDIDKFLKEYLSTEIDKNTGIGGIDSAILAPYLPKGTKAYDLEHKIVNVYWEDYLQFAPKLMEHKKAPLHAIEVALYKAGIEAKKDNINKLIVGNGADSNFGGMDKLLSKDWLFDEFVNRYTFVMPNNVLKEYSNIDYIYEPFRRGEYIDYLSFLNKVHGVGIIQAFENSFSLAGIKAIEPYENIYLNDKLDLNKIRNGNSKYLIRELFKERYPNFSVVEKIPFRRPMEKWLSDYNGNNIREEFISENISSLSGDQKWLVYCLEWFMNINNL